MATAAEILVQKGSDVVSVLSSWTVRQVAEKMIEANVGCVLVEEAEGDPVKVIGIFTERDLLRRVVAAGRDPAGTTLRDVMTSPVARCELAEEVDEILDRMTDRHIRHLAVIEGDALVGMVSLRDVLRTELRDSDERLHDLGFETRGA